MSLLLKEMHRAGIYAEVGHKAACHRPTKFYILFAGDDLDITSAFTKHISQHALLELEEELRDLTNLGREEKKFEALVDEAKVEA